MNILDKNSGANSGNSGRRRCAIPSKCERTAAHRDLMTAEWEELVIRYDDNAGRYVTRVACCPGAPVC